jgi:hypothetical protein
MTTLWVAFSAFTKSASTLADNLEALRESLSPIIGVYFDRDWVFGNVKITLKFGLFRIANRP